VVLGAQVLRGGRPSETLRARTLHAASLYLSGDIGLVVVTGGVGEHPPSEARVMASILRDVGVPQDAIVEEGRARSTRESAKIVGAMLGELRRDDPGEVVLVTDPLHCVRAVRAFLAEGVLTTASPAYGSPQWRVARRRRAQFLRELGALLWYEAAGAARRIKTRQPGKRARYRP
jgi:uncharacterized SAM-binding protein YcdF (DUF218 family)